MWQPPSPRSNHDTEPPGFFEQPLAELKSRELPVPAVFSGQEPMPLALSTRADMPTWAAAHDCDAAGLATLERVIAARVRSKAYQAALSADLSVRFTLDGEPAEPVSPQDRLSAALSLHTRALKDAGLARPPEVKKVEPPVVPRRPIISLGSLSPQEVERRRAALAKASP